MNEPGVSVPHSLMLCLNLNDSRGTLVGCLTLISWHLVEGSLLFFKALASTSCRAPCRECLHWGHVHPFLFLGCVHTAFYTLLPLHFISLLSHSFLPFPWKVSRKFSANNWGNITETEDKEGKGLERDKPLRPSVKASLLGRASSLKRPCILHFPLFW